MSAQKLILHPIRKAALDAGFAAAFGGGAVLGEGTCHVLSIRPQDGVEAEGFDMENKTSRSRGIGCPGF